MKKQTKKTNYEKYFKGQAKDNKYRKEYEQELRRIKYAYKIAELRKKEGLSQKEFAKKMKTTQSVVSRMEQGGQNVTLDYLEKVAGIFGRDLSINFKIKNNRKARAYL